MDKQNIWIAFVQKLTKAHSRTLNWDGEGGGDKS